MNPHLVLDVLTIVLIDLLLAGDNAVIIALAVKTLSARQRRLGISLGAGVAVVLRIVLTFFAARLLQVEYVKMAGGALILWIAVKLLANAVDEDAAGGHQATSVWSAMWYILVADVTMSLDNILAVAGTSQGNVWLLIFGLGLSIPFVVFTSSLLARIMDRWPLIVWLGAAILGRVGGQMIVEDPFVHGRYHPPHAVDLGVQVFCTVGVLAAGWWGARRSRQRVPGLTPDRTNS